MPLFHSKYPYYVIPVNVKHQTALPHYAELHETLNKTYVNVKHRCKNRQEKMPIQYNSLDFFQLWLCMLENTSEII